MGANTIYTPIVINNTKTMTTSITRYIFYFIR
jgi:hypothetical protein